jgi:hypothetical protein
MIDNITAPREAAILQVVTGILTNIENGYPLVGLRVAAYLGTANTPPNPQDPIDPNGSQILWGEGISDSNGRFQIISNTSQPAPPQPDLLRQAEDATLTLMVEIPNREPYLRIGISVESTSSVDVNLLIPLPTEPVPSHVWQDLGVRLEDARLVQLHDIVQHLMHSESGASLFSDWDVTLRHSIVTELEHAFLDPTRALQTIAPPPGFHTLQTSAAFEQYKAQIEPYLADSTITKAFTELQAKVAAFDSLVDVDWVVDLTGFQLANPAAAISAFQDLYRSVPFATTRMDTRKDLGEKFDDPIRYRDYLRAIWTTIALHDFEPIFRDRAHEEAALAQLNVRFHQDFLTKELTERPANEILISIVREILVATEGGYYGFGIPSATIAARGTRTARQYLDYLISLTKLSAQELGLRYRLNLDRPDTVLSTAVHENISTLQHFFRDSFQCSAEPFSIIPEHFEFKAPFFLEYEEWLRTKAPFYPENYYRIFEAFDLDLAAYIRWYVELPRKERFDDFPDLDEGKVRSLIDATRAGYKKFSSGQLAEAKEEYANADNLWEDLLRSPNFKAASVHINGYHPITGRALRYLGSLTEPAEEYLLRRRATPIKTMFELERFWDFLRVPTNFSSSAPSKAIQCGLYYWWNCVMPTALGDLALAQGDYPSAVRYYGRNVLPTVCMADTDSVDPYDGYGTVAWKDVPYLYTSGSLPYTFWERRDSFPRLSTLHPMEVKFFQLRLGNAMLEWADALYRTDDSSNKARARELYKGVLFMHGERPPIAPTWSTPAPWDAEDPSRLVFFVHHTENPARAEQKARARLGFLQLEAGLNYFGYRDDEIPILRYRTLKDAADRFAALAKSAQADFLTYLEKIEEATKESILINNLRKKAVLQTQIAAQQGEIAKYSVRQAEKQRKQVEEAIEAKRKEIEEKDSFFSQVKDFASGFMDTYNSAPGTEKAEDGIAAGGEGAAAGAGVLVAYALFVYCSYVSLSAMTDAANKRRADLSTLRDQALPVAQALIQVRQREVTIAGLQGEIAQADADLAHDLLTFQSIRFLNIEFWSQLTTLMKRLLRRYLELGARMAWLAERALVYEQARAMNFIRFDYFPTRLQGVTGADLLQLDLAELDASRLASVRQKLPVKHTFSLVRDFPVQFAQLKKTGRCTFRTEEQFFQQAYPGIYGCRLRAVSVAVEMLTPTPPVRGLLINQGISLLSTSDDEKHLLVRPTDAFPLSEFSLQKDMAVYNLPDETLLTFEGSGVETFWELRIPAIANPYGLSEMADILFTLDAFAQFSPDLYEKHLKESATSVRRLLLASASKLQPGRLKALQDKAWTDSVRFDFNLAAIGLAKEEENRKIKNLAIWLTGKQSLNFTATCEAVLSSIRAKVVFEESVAFSNAPLTPESPPHAPMPLNALIDQEVLQTFSLIIDKSASAGIDFSGVTNVVLGVEYVAELRKS